MGELSYPLRAFKNEDWYLMDILDNVGKVRETYTKHSIGKKEATNNFGEK